MRKIILVVALLVVACGSSAVGDGIFFDQDLIEDDILVTEDIEESPQQMVCKNDSDCYKSSLALCHLPYCDVAEGEDFGVCNFEILAGDGSACNDEQLCTEGDHCVQGTCVGGLKKCDDGNKCTKDYCDSNTGKCKSELSQDICDDHNSCTQDWCEPASGCSHVDLPNGKPCEDGDLCTKEESCLIGKCVPEDYLECDDHNPCTEDYCDSVDGCVFEAKLYLPCDDGNACTLGDMCNEDGKCAGSANLDCDDGESCTEDWCEPGVGCKHQTKEDGKQCNDGDACTLSDFCQSGVCTPEQVLDCLDNNPCTTDYCDPQKGCVLENIPEGDPCDDKDACTLGNYCHNGECLYEKTLDCDDGDQCTKDSCDSIVGCLHKPAPDGADCEDGNPCTNDHCQGGECVVYTLPKPNYLYPTVDDIDAYNWDCYEVQWVDGVCGLVVKEEYSCNPVDCMKIGNQWKHVSKQPYSGVCKNFFGNGVAVTATAMQTCKVGCFYDY